MKNNIRNIGSATFLGVMLIRTKVTLAQTTIKEPTPSTTEKDNTARNVRDRDNATLTALDQGNSKADVDTTAQIRKEIIDRKNMSVNAKNVKIITMNGHVTLRGPVNTTQEKRHIGKIAIKIAGLEKVDNQLEVMVETSKNNQ